MSESETSFIITIASIELTIIAIGFIGNVICIIVFSKKTFRNNSISTYCIALAIAECINITQFIIDIYLLAYNAYLMDQSDLFCKIAHINLILIHAIPPYMMIALSVDKLLTMRTNSIALLKKKWFQWSIVAAIVLFHIALYMYFPIIVKRLEISPGYFLCDVSTVSFFNTHLIVFLFETCLIPLGILAITSTLTIRVLIKSRNAVMKPGQVSQERKSRDRKYAFSSLLLNVVYLVFKLPSLVFFILSAFYSYFDIYLYTFGFLFFFICTSLGFFVHLATNSLFRREFLVLFRFVKRNKGSSVINSRAININKVSSIM